jgi:4-oxalocrotonate tautomerase
MPHLIVKLYSGRSEQQKSALAEAITKAVMETLSASRESISVGIEDVAPKDWTELVYEPEISGKPHTIYEKPGYDPR